MKNSIQNIIKTVFIFSLFFTVFSAQAQAPQKFTYQAVIRNASNALVTNTNVGIRVSILQGSETGTASYVETHTATTNANGLVNLQIGGGTVAIGTFTGINWTSGTYYIKIETDITGGTNYNIIGTNQLLSVPYALNSADNKWADFGGNISNTNTGNVGIGINIPNYKLHVGTSLNAMRIEGPGSASGTALSIGGFGKIEIDAPGNIGGRFNIQDNGNVGIGTITPAAKLDVAGGNWNLTGTSAGDFRVGNATQNFKLGVATSGGGAGHTTMTSTSILSLGTGTTDPNIRTLNIAGGKVGIGITIPTTALEVNGFTKLGSDAPAIKVKKLIGTSPTGQLGQVLVPHGLNSAKILSVNILVEYLPGEFISENHTSNLGSVFNYSILGSAISITNAVSSYNILSKPLKILITYEE